MTGIFIHYRNYDYVNEYIENWEEIRYKGPVLMAVLNELRELYIHGYNEIIPKLKKDEGIESI